MKKIKVLLLGAGGNVSQGILKAIRSYDFAKEQVEVEVVGACISPESLGLYMCDKACVGPYASDPSFTDWVIDLCNQEDIDLILTGVEENIIALQRDIDKIEHQTKAIFVASPLESLRMGQDKLLTCQWLEEHELEHPAYCRLEDEGSVRQLVEKVGFPLIAKPCHGKGSRGVCYLKDQAALDSLQVKDDYVLQECIGDASKEYTVGCYCDKQGQLQEIIVMHRKLENGYSAITEVVDDPVVYQEAKRICEAFRPCGPLNIQMRKANKERAVCFELNVRFSGTTPMRDHFGYRDVIAMIKEYCLEESIKECFQIKKGMACRYINEFYLDRNPVEQLQEQDKVLDMDSFAFAEQHVERSGKR